MTTARNYMQRFILTAAEYGRLGQIREVPLSREVVRRGSDLIVMINALRYNGFVKEELDMWVITDAGCELLDKYSRNNGQAINYSVRISNEDEESFGDIYTEGRYLCDFYKENPKKDAQGKTYVVAVAECIREEFVKEINKLFPDSLR